MEEPNNYFVGDFTRDELCSAYANEQGSKYSFTDKDFAWADEYEYATKMTDEQLKEWYYNNYW
jgi:hypothetical protein